MFQTILATIDYVYFLPVVAFFLFAAGAWLLIDWMTTKKTNVEQRLEELRDPKRRRRAAVEERSNNVLSARNLMNVVKRASPAFAKPLQPKSEQDVGKLKSRLAQAGFRSEAAPTVFLGLKFVCLILGLFFGGGFMIISSKLNGGPVLSQNSLVKCVALAGVMFYLPAIGLFFLQRRRKEQIFLGLPDALDLMVVCVEAGLGLDQAMRKVSEEMRKSYHVIAEEFGLCNLQMQMGRGRSEVLQDLGRRTGVDDLRALASILIQADKFGSSIAQALRVQSDSMRTRRRQIAEEKAAKTAVKLIFPLVIFIFPGIFVVLVGPAAITMVRDMFPAMSGKG